MMCDALVIGGGPAGLMAAETLARAGRKVLLAEAKPSVGRKFLMAGKSGLNLTKDEPPSTFLKAFPERARLRPMLDDFAASDVIAWAESVGQEVFTGSSGRVFPVAMKASPLLRAWLARLSTLGVEIRTRWRWTGGLDTACFATPDGDVHLTPRVLVLALGGASWARLGSDGAWAGLFPASDIAPFAPANMGFGVAWSDHMRPHFGAPVKPVGVRAADTRITGEFVVSAKGLEGGAIYAISRALRQGQDLHLDLVPDLTLDAVRARLAAPRGKMSQSNFLRKALRLSPVKRALLMEFARPLPADLAPVLKDLPVPLTGPLPIDQAISVAGGLRFDALDDGLMVRARPGVFACGEMLDWEAPTGGYLLTACLATGLWAGRHAAQWG